MAYYLARAKMSQHAMQALVDRPEDRLVTMTKLLQGVGGRLHNYFFSFGEYDIVMIYELPDHVTAASLSMVLSASGSVTEIDTTVLLSMEEAVASMRSAGTAMGVYRPPGRSIPRRTAKRPAKAGTNARAPAKKAPAKARAKTPARKPAAKRKK